MNHMENTGMENGKMGGSIFVYSVVQKTSKSWALSAFMLRKPPSRFLSLTLDRPCCLINGLALKKKTQII